MVAAGNEREVARAWPRAPPRYLAATAATDLLFAGLLSC